MPFDSIPQRLMSQAKMQPDAFAYGVRSGPVWRMTSYRAYAAEVRRAAKALMAFGLLPGSTVSILGKNRPEWVVMDMACMAIGGAPVGIYTTCSPEEARYIVHHAESRLALVEDAQSLDKIREEWRRMPILEHIVLMRGAASGDDPRVMGWDDFLARGDAIADERVDERVDALEPDGLATLIYTSGTTGPPKGVMLSHENLAWTADVTRRINGLTSADTNLSYLPLSHIAEQAFTIHVPAITGGTTYFAESADRFADNLEEVQPTLFFGSPRIWEKLRARLGPRTEKASVGLGRARVCLTGSAPIARELLDFFASIGVLIREVYGQSEGSGPTSFNLPGRFKFDSVGPILPGVEARIAEDGEILVKGPNVFLGYAKDPEATAETLVDGWLRSGDLGRLDEEGFLHITGRKKDIIITAGGQNIAPGNIEAALKNHPLIADAVVIGDRRKYLTALLTLDMEAARRFAAERGQSGAAPLDLSPIHVEVQRAVDEVNSHLARVETIKKFRILPRAFALEHGELTPTLKLKRRKVHERFAEEIESMYAE